MRALVIGGNRFVGKRLVQALLNDGTEVTLLNRGQRGDGFGDRVRRIVLDRGSLCKNHDGLGDSTWDIIYDFVCFDADEAKGFCDAFESRTPRAVFISTQSVYGSTPSPQLESAFDPRTHQYTDIADRHKDYGEAKRQAEAVLFNNARFELTAVRFPFILGPDDYTRRLSFHVEHALQGKPVYFPNRTARISVIQSSDAARFLFGLLRSPFPGPVNVCSEAPLSLQKLRDFIEHTTHRHLPLADSPSEGDHSPYGVESDAFMSADKAKHAGFVAQPIEDWLPALIAESSRSL